MLYHLSNNIFKDIEKFTPRIPDSILKKEDSISKRVCCSNSIEGALLAMPENKVFLSSKTGTMPVLKVYEIDEKDILPNCLLSSEQISDKVPDALKTNEYWIKQSICPKNSYIIKITKINFDKKLNVINNIEYEKLNNTDNIDDFFNLELRFTATNLKILNKNKIELNEMFNQIEDNILDSISNISEEYYSKTSVNNREFTLYIEGYFMGEFVENGFIYDHDSLIEKIKQNIYKQFICKYELILEIL